MISNYTFDIHFCPKQFQIKESTLLFTVFYSVRGEEVFQRNVQVPEDLRPRFYSFAT